MNKEDMIDLLKESYRKLEKVVDYLEGAYFESLKKKDGKVDQFTDWYRVLDDVHDARYQINDAVWYLEGVWIE